jgi:hypothetical protein
MTSFSMLFGQRQSNCLVLDILVPVMKAANCLKPLLTTSLGVSQGHLA